MDEQLIELIKARAIGDKARVAVIAEGMSPLDRLKVIKICSRITEYMASLNQHDLK